MMVKEETYNRRQAWDNARVAKKESSFRARQKDCVSNEI